MNNICNKQIMEAIPKFPLNGPFVFSQPPTEALTNYIKLFFFFFHQGSAPQATQIKFWKTCLDTIHHLQNFSQPGKKETSDPQLASILVSHLAHSPHLLPTLKVCKKYLTKCDRLMSLIGLVKWHQWAVMVTPVINH